MEGWLSAFKKNVFNIKGHWHTYFFYFWEKIPTFRLWSPVQNVFTLYEKENKSELIFIKKIVK